MDVLINKSGGKAVAFVDDSQVGELLDAGGWNDWQMVMVCMQKQDLVQIGGWENSAQT